MIGMQFRIRRPLACLPALAALVLPMIACAGEADPLTPGQIAFFEQRIRPLLIERCYSCHSDAKKVNGGLRLDSRRGLIEGGDSGPAVSPGKPEESLLIKAVRYQDSNLQMPPEGRLAMAELAALKNGCDAAPPIRGQISPAAKHRTLPGRRSTLGLSAATSGCPSRGSRRPMATGSVDRFVLAKLEASGWHPSLDADRYLWLRRVSL